MRGPTVRPYVVAAGGTGGHLFPAEALAAELVRRGERVVLMTDGRSGAIASAGFATAERHVLPGAGLAGQGLRRAAAGVAALAAGTWRARALLADLRPAAVVGFGGYPSVPPVLAARLLPASHRPAVVLHEQNAVLGRANRVLCRGVDLLALCFADTARVPPAAPVGVLGNPVRPAVAALAGLPFEPPTDGGTLRLLVLGGSLGARVFADVVPAAVALLPPSLRARLAVVQQCRAEDEARVRAAYAELAVPAELSPFFPDVARLYAAAHLVVSRAGAGSVAEVACVGRPSVLVPLPSAIDDHQSANARALGAAGAAVVLAQPAFTARVLAEVLVARLDDPTLLARAASAAAALARPDAAARLADRVQELAHHQIHGEAG